jgi:glycosyltransferase involved in cell wall biosynthesis
VIAAHQLGIPCLLEVNALIVDPPAVRKRRIDDALGGPMRRWAVQQCLWADRIVTPLHTTIPPEIERAKIVQLPWGAAVDRFGGDRISSSDSATQTHPEAASHSTNHKRPTVVFLGSFRAWHGVMEFVRAADTLLTAGHDVQFLLIGDGPERVAAEQLAKRWPEHIHFTGAVHYEQVPELLSQAVVGVAPFNTEPHPALRLAGFFWSPLKVYEYMAAELPVVTTDIAPLNAVVRDGIEGMLFREGDVAGLAAAIARLLDDPAAARLMGQRGRARVVANFSWAKHCEDLERVMMNMLLSGCDHPVI